MKGQRAFDKSEPVTASERYLQGICEKSFLALWTYPGIFRNQGKDTPSSHGKEVCDLVVVFREHVILFSDKSCHFSETGNWDVDWDRWYRKAIKKSADQLWGAERWFRDFQDRLYLDRACTQPFPITLPEPSSIQFHRIAVARGASEACKNYHKGGSGSLMIMSGWSEAEAEKQGAKKPLFAVGDIDPTRGYVHVYDEITLDILLTTLDTITDFIGYIEKKERFVRSPSFAIAAGEEEILALYFQSTSESGELDFPYEVTRPLGNYGNATPIMLPDGGWNELTRSPDWRALNAWREPSYYWDFLIQRLASHTISGTLYRGEPDESPRVQEHLLRILAAEPRYRRRQLSAAFLGQIQRAPDDDVLDRSSRVFPATEPREPTYVFLVVGRDEQESHDDYRTRRRELLHAYAYVTKYLYPEAGDIVAFGVEARDVQERTEDVLFVDAREWNDEMAAEAKHLMEEHSILNKTINYRVESEPRHYLHAKYIRKRGEEVGAISTGRNDPCPCGSGRKYKRCHGAARV